MDTDIIPYVLAEYQCSDLTTDLGIKLTLAKIDPDNRAILLLWCAGYTQAEIGALINVSQPAVNKRINQN